MIKPQEIKFPIYGIFKGGAVSQQPALTSPVMSNVRPRDKDDNRVRGGQRPGLDKWGSGTQVGDTEQPVVAMCAVNSVK